MGATRLALAGARTPRSLTAGRGWGVGVAAEQGGPGRGGSRGAGRCGPHQSAPGRVRVWGHRVRAHAAGGVGTRACVHPSRGGPPTQSHTLPGTGGVAAPHPRGVDASPSGGAAVRAELPQAPGLSRASHWVLRRPLRVPDPGPWKVRAGSSPCFGTFLESPAADGGPLSTLSARGLRPRLPASTPRPSMLTHGVGKESLGGLLMIQPGNNQALPGISALAEPSPKERQQGWPKRTWEG